MSQLQQQFASVLKQSSPSTGVSSSPTLISPPLYTKLSSCSMPSTLHTAPAVSTNAMPSFQPSTINANGPSFMHQLPPLASSIPQELSKKNDSFQPYPNTAAAAAITTNTQTSSSDHAENESTPSTTVKMTWMRKLGVSLGVLAVSVLLGVVIYMLIIRKKRKHASLHNSSSSNNNNPQHKPRSRSSHKNPGDLPVSQPQAQHGQQAYPSIPIVSPPPHPIAGTVNQSHAMQPSYYPSQTMQQPSHSSLQVNAQFMSPHPRYTGVTQSIQQQQQQHQQQHPYPQSPVPPLSLHHQHHQQPMHHNYPPPLAKNPSLSMDTDVIQVPPASYYASSLAGGRPYPPYQSTVPVIVNNVAPPSMRAVRHYDTDQSSGDHVAQNKPPVPLSSQQQQQTNSKPTDTTM